MEEKKREENIEEKKAEQNLQQNIQEEKTEDQDEKTEKMLREQAEDIVVPDSLLPEEIEKRLMEQEKRKKKKLRRRIASLAAAACLCLAVGIPGYMLITEQDRERSRAGAEETSSETTAVSSSETASAASQDSLLATAEDYDEIYEYVQAEKEYWDDVSYGMEESASDSGSNAGGSSASSVSAYDSAAATGTKSASESASGEEYSDTNVREEGVGEGDIVKTDGKNIYIVSGERIHIVGTGNAQMEQLAQIEVEEGGEPSEVYAQDGILVVVYTKTEYNDGENGYDGFYRQYTCADIYDVSSPENPEKAGEVSQSGYFNTMRIRDGYVYILSSFYADSAAARDDQAAYIPEVQGKLIAADSIYMPQSRMGNSYTVISSFALDDPEERTDSKAVFGNTGICYVSTENIYITEAVYEESDSSVNQTSVRKVAYGDGKLEGAGQTKVDGILKDSFSIDEHEGNLRLVTTVTRLSAQPDRDIELFSSEQTEEQTESNTLYVLDENLKVIGEIRDLAEDESVYSARFMGDTGYFVTFRQIDPLFSVDLSDPENPKILGELKIPGFSDYLHPYGDGLLLGIGMDVDESGTTTEGAKLSMFDISDPSDVKEKHKYVIEGMYSTDVYDYRSVFADVEKNLFGFSAYGDSQKYYIFSYDKNDGFQPELERTLGTYGNTRGLYIGELFYLVSGNTVEAYTLDGFEKVDDIVL